ncbi:glycosyltransferase [Dorea formicigenerans]|nr:glycosyltransferase [Dorea formicigenerans]
MDKISVLMSVYNENEHELMLAVNSILNQTYEEFEFIIVCDNPLNQRMVEIVYRIAEMDSRIKIVMNNRNVGLALSMNHGFEFATGNIIARMDADDISFPDRFEKQVECLNNSSYDLVWTSYIYIDENGKEQDDQVQIYSDSDVNKILPLRNIVHHPTVMMKRDAFVKAGLYRDFPCAQDYDLWLRMLCCGCKIHMMPENMLYYRVRNMSTTNRKKYQQLCTLNYIRKLYTERCKNGIDTYSYDSYLKDMERKGVGNRKIEDQFFKANYIISQSKKNLKKHNYAMAINGYIKAFIISKAYRKQLLLLIKRKLGR